VKIPLLEAPTISEFYKAFRDGRKPLTPVGCRPRTVAIEQYEFDNNIVYVVRCPDGDAEYVKWGNVEALFEQIGWVAAWHGDDKRPESDILIWDDELDDMEEAINPQDLYMPKMLISTTASTNLIWTYA
jgi:triacylglycerol esterase/lipase EstA (alpha/beta hydrolase family)